MHGFLAIFEMVTIEPPKRVLNLARERDAHRSGKITSLQDQVDAYLAEFLPGTRRRLDEFVEAFVQHPSSRHLLIIGGPGVGKSAFIAHLANKYGCPRYFTRTREELELASTWLSPRVFLITIGHQLREKYGSGIFGKRPALRGEVKVDIASDDAEAVGVEIEDAYVSPFRELRVRGSGKARTVTGRARVIGSRIRRLHDSTLAMTERELLHEAILDPLARLRATRPSERVVLLLDGLDVAVQQPGANILDVLPRAENLRVIATSRPGRHLARFPADEKAALSETAEIETDGTTRSFVAENRDDALRYVEHIVMTDEAIAPVARATAGSKVREYVDLIAERSEGNFLYLHHFFRALRQDIGQGRPDPFSRQAVPTGLHDLYRVILSERIMREVPEERWEDVYTPVLGTLAVAREALTRANLSSFAGVDASQVDSVRRRIEEFLDVIPRKGEAKYRFYHSSFSEYLLDREHNRDALDAPRFHWKIASYYRGSQSAWAEVRWGEVKEEYPFRHLATHLREAGPPHHAELYALIGRPWMDAKLIRYHSNQSFSEDVEVAVRVAASGAVPSFEPLVRMSLVFAAVGDLATAAPPEALAVLALGEESDRQLALGEAHLIQDPERKAKAFELIGDSLLRQGKTSAAVNAWLDALDAVRKMEGEEARDKATGRIARSLAQAGDTEAALTAAGRCTADYLRAEALVAVTEVLAEGGRVAELEQVLHAANSVGHEDARVRSLAAVGRALARAGRPEEARRIARDALQTAESIPPDERRAEALTAVARLFGMAGDPAAIRDVLAIADTLDTVARSVAFEGLAGVLAEAGDLEGLHRLLRKIDAFEYETSRGYVRCGLGPALARMNEVETAIKVARSISDQELRAKTLGDTALILRGSKNEALAARIAREALKSATGLTDPIRRTWTLGAIVRALAEAGGRKMAQEGARRALNTSLDIGETSRAWAQHNLATALAGAGLIDQAIDAIELIVDEEKRIEALEAAAGMFAAFRADQAAREALDKTLRVAQSLKGTLAKGRAIAKVAFAFSRSGGTRSTRGVAEKALAALGDLAGEAKSGDGLACLALDLARSGELEIARPIAGRAMSMRSSDAGWHQGEAMSAMAQAFAEVGDEAHALEAARLVDGHRERAFALGRLAREFLKRGRSELARRVAGEAWKAARQAPGPAWVLPDVAPVLAEAGRPDLASEAAKRALSAVGSMAEDKDQASALVGVIRSLCLTGERTLALRASARFRRVMRTFDDGIYQAADLVDVAMTIAGWRDRAELARLMPLVDAMEDPLARSRAIAGLGRAFATIGDKDGLLRAIKEARGLEGSEKASALAAIARACFETDQAARARELVHAAWEATYEVEDDLFRSRAIGEVVEVVAETGVKWILDQALAEVKGIDGDLAKVEGLAAVGRALATVGDREGVFDALQLLSAEKWEGVKSYGLQLITPALARLGEFHQAAALARSIHYAHYRVQAQIELTRALWDAGQRPLAGEVAEDASASAQANNDENTRDRALKDAARVLLLTGRADRAQSTATLIEPPRQRAAALGDLTELLVRDGRQDEGLTMLGAGFLAARLAGASAMYGMLAHGALALAKIDGGRTLRRVMDELAGVHAVVA